MRIIGGNLKGRHFKPYKKFTGRATTDFAKEGLFNVLDNMYYFEGLEILDLFAGTGNISIEFASRGAKKLVLVEKNKLYLNYIKRTVSELFPDKLSNFTFINYDVFAFVKEYPLNYDIIFADPPYQLPNFEQLPDLIFSNTSIRDDTLFILEHSRFFKFQKHPYFRMQRKYGSVNFSFFSKEKL